MILVLFVISIVVLERVLAMAAPHPEAVAPPIGKNSTARPANANGHTATDLYNLSQNLGPTVGSTAIDSELSSAGKPPQA